MLEGAGNTCASWSAYKERDPEGAAQFAKDYKSSKIEVIDSRTTVVNQQDIYIDFTKLDDILAGRVRATDKTTDKPVSGQYGETFKHEISHFLYQFVAKVLRNDFAIQNAGAEEAFADSMDETFDNNSATQSNLRMPFLINPPPSQQVIVNQANGSQTTTEINNSEPPAQ